MVARLVLVLALAAAPSIAAAAGFVITGRGARSFSRGGAVIASIDDLNAQWLNPARLALIPGRFSAWIDVDLAVRSTSFSRAPDPRVQRNDPRYPNGFPVATNGASLQPVPGLAVGSDLGLDGFMVALGVHAPMGTQQDWASDGPQRYSLTRTTAVQLTYQVSVAWRPIPDLAIGLGFQLTDFLMRQEMAVSTYPGIFGWQEDPSMDATIRIDAGQRFIPGFVLGLWGRPLPHLELGVSFQTGFSVKADGELKFRRPEHYYFSTMRVEGSDISFETRFPWILRLGVRWVFPGGHDVELGYIFTAWSQHESITVSPSTAGGLRFVDVPGLGTYVVRPFTVQEDFVDTHSVHLGGSYMLLGGDLELRAGGYYESSTTPDATLNVQTIDSDKVLVGLGVAYRLGELRFTLGYAHIFYATRTITSSEKTQVNPLFEEDQGPFGSGGPSVVGNGRYASTAEIIGLSIDYTWRGSP